MNFNRLKRFYLIGFFLILFLPLLNLPPWFSPPDWGKTIAFRIVLAIMIFAFIWQFLYETQPRNEVGSREKRVFRERTSVSSSQGIKTILFLLLALFGIFLLATIFSLEPHFSLWGNPYRAGGFVNFAFYIIFAVLAFFVIRQRDWQKIWDFSIIIGILVSIIAIFQQFGIFKEIFIYTASRPPSTIGITTALAIYLLLLTFLTLAFAIKTPWRKWFWAKKLFYFLSFLLFIIVSVFITQTRSVYIGLTIGFLYFLFFYPIRKSVEVKLQQTKKAILIKVLAVILLALISFAVYYVNTQPELPQLVKENKFLNWSAARLSIKTALKDPRISGWPVAFEAAKSRPILGYGPENFSIGFDKFFDPTLPLFLRTSSGDWWDRAHNFFMDTVCQAGILALIIYLALFGALFWQLQKTKNQRKSANISENQSPLICHGIQATILGYLAANFFSFDVFSTYLISFLIIGYSLSLMRPGFIDETRSRVEVKLQQTQKYKIPVIFLLLVGLTWFIWEYNIKPFQINTQINIAMYQAENENFEGAVLRMENILPQNSFLDNYLRLKYVEVIGNCIEKNPETVTQLAPRAYEILKENTKIRPYYTRTWMLLGTYTNRLIIKEQATNPELAEILKGEADYYLQKANELSPKRQEIFVEWIKTDFYRERYKEAKEKAQKCIEYNPNFRDCYWQMYLANIYLENEEEAEEYLKIAKEKRYPINSEISLLELVNAYIKTENYQKLAETYQKLIKLKPKNVQYHASLAVCYQKLGQFDKAREEALRVFELSPESKAEVEKFLQQLPD